MMQDEIRKISRWTLQGLAIIATVLLAYLVYRELLYPIEESETYSLPMVLIMMILYSTLLLLVWNAIQRSSERTLRMVVVIILAVVCALQLCIAVGMQLQPNVDLIYILEQNRSMVESGEHIFSDRSYFAMYTNNIGLAIVEYWVFRLAHLLGCSNYELVGGVFNVVMNLVTYVCAYRTVSRFCSRRVSVLFLFYLVTNPALYAYASYYYTDTVSMAMTLAAVDLFTCAWKATDDSRRRVGLYALSGFILLFAIRVRVTSSFILIAAVVYGLLQGHMRRLMHAALPVAVGLLAATLCYGGLYHYHINFDTEDKAIPWQHWVAMGVNPETGGRYLEDDYAETIAQPDHDAMVDVNVQKWKDRVRANGISGNVELALNKEAVVWSYGDKMYWQYVHNVKEYTPVYEWIAGRYSEYFRNYMLAANAALLIVMLLNVLGSVIGRERSGWQQILLIYWLGAVLFYVFWEAHPRQSLSYMALLSMMALPLFVRLLEQIDLPMRKRHV